MKVDKAKWVADEYMGPGYFGDTSEQSPFNQTTPAVDFQKVVTIKKKTQDLPISIEFKGDEQFDLVSRTGRDMVEAAQLTQSRDGMEVFNKAFTTQLTNDGQAFISNSHLLINGDTYSNLISGALSPTTIEAMTVALYEMKKHDGTLGAFNPYILLVPPTLQAEATEYTKSTLRPATANNNVYWLSELYPGLKVMQSPFLGAAHGGSDTAYFMLSNKHSVYHFIHTEMQMAMVDWQYSTNGENRLKAYYREKTDVVSGLGVVGATGV